MTVPYTFATAITSLPLNQLDTNFATPITLGNVACYLGNTVPFIGNLNLGNATISSGNATVTNLTASNVTLTGGTISNITFSSINNTPIGNVTPSTGSFTTLNLGLSTQSVAIGQGNSSTLKNRIINGAMVIDQRNAGASVTPTDNQYLLDRWSAGASAASKYTVQQNAGSVTPPVGFSNYLGVTSSSAYSISNSDYFYVVQKIEGYNFADLGWGTANAKTVTLSFQVYSSLTGTFGGAFRNSAANRSYPFSYSISVANTWTTISVTVAGDTTGTWVGATNGIGVYVDFGLGVGSTYSATAGTWATGNYVSATGETSVVGTSGATFYITGVQLEVGSSATGYEYRQYGQELALCQRYFETNFFNTAVPTNNYAQPINLTVGSNTYGGGAGANQQQLGQVFYKVTKRANPTLSIYSVTSSTLTAVSNGYSLADFAANSGKINFSDANGFSIYNNTGSNITTGGFAVSFNFGASAEL